MKKQQENLLWPVKKYWYLFVIYAVMSYLVTQVVVDGSNRIAGATDQLFRGETVQLYSLLLPFLILTLIGTTAAYLKSYSQNAYSIRVQTEMKNITAGKLVKLSYRYYDSTGTGSIMNKLISDIYQVEALFSEVLPEAVMGLIMIITISVYILVTDVRLFLVTVICYPLLLWLANYLSKKMGKLSGNRRKLYDDLEETALDCFHGMIVGRTYNLEPVMGKRSRKVVDDILKNEYVRAKVNTGSQFIGNFIRWMPRVVCYLFALYEVFKSRMSVGDLLAFTMLLDRIVHPMGEIPGYINAIREQMVSFQRINDIVKQPDEPSGDGCFQSEENQSAISLSHIHFGYDEDRTIFEDFNLEIPAGKNVALVGSSGGGKSTVFKILCGFYLPDQGSYKLYGHAYEEWNVRELRKQFTLVSQNVFLFPGTIADNVAYGHEGATLDQVKEACKNANIHDFIEELPDGYDTTVGERGVKLSGGQRQRISIARAFLKAAPILLLDEPTSAVDVETEELIKDAIRKISVGKTVITIAHRLSTIENADRIFVFDHGKIAECGTHDELLKAGGLYQSLYTRESEVMDQQPVEEDTECKRGGER